MSRLLVLMGSGETTPTMVTTHQRVLAEVGSDAVLLDTPYGFQENAAEISRRAQEYFRRHVGREVEVLEAPRPATMTEMAREALLDRIRSADWIFAGPGSPSYLLRQWRDTRLPAVLGERLRRRHGATVFASAAAVTLGRHALPVYEIYKAGADPAWLDGLDVLREIGLDAVVIPHFDNAEGGTHDTRYCYLGERRLGRLEQDLADDTWILGIDEHTAAVIDLDAGTLRTEGRGRVTVRRQGRNQPLDPQRTVPLAEVVALARHGDGTVARGGGSAPATAAPDEATAGLPPPRPTPLVEELAALEAAFDRAVAAYDAVAATDITLRLEQTIHDWAADTDVNDELAQARDLLRAMVTRLGRIAAAGLHDHTELIAPYLDTLVHVRDELRAKGAFDEADHIRTHMEREGVAIRDTPAGTTWEWDEERHGPADPAGRRR